MTLAELLAICSRLKELTIVESAPSDGISCEIILPEWAKIGFVPQVLNVIIALNVITRCTTIIWAGFLNKHWLH